MIRVPTDKDISDAIRSLGGSAKGSELLESLKNRGYDNRESQRVMQRCLDRGIVKLGNSLRLTIDE